MKSIHAFGLDDPRWMPLSYDDQSDCFMFALVDEDSLQHAFLDQRIGEPWNRRSSVAVTTRPELAVEPRWLFHTAFCCSTLLARALHAPPEAIALKEPSTLLDLARMSLQSNASTSKLLDHRIKDAIHLLGRPWARDGRVIIKPTNAANRLLPKLLAAAPTSRAVLLHGGLEDFLLSCVKKLPGAEEPIQWMAQYLVPGTRLQHRLRIPPGHQFNFIEACVLIWHAQMEIYSDALASDAGDRIRTLGMSTLLAQPEEAVDACAKWLGLNGPLFETTQAERVRNVFSRNSKQTEARYGPAHRSQERKQIMERFRELIRAAITWSDQEVGPHAALPTDWKPLIDS